MMEAVRKIGCKIILKCCLVEKIASGESLARLACAERIQDRTKQKLQRHMRFRSDGHVLAKCCGDISSSGVPSDSKPPCVDPEIAPARRHPLPRGQSIFQRRGK